MKKIRLTVISGQDRVGKDTYMDMRDNMSDNTNSYHYITRPDGDRPDYRYEKDEWTRWLNALVKKQADELAYIAKNAYEKGENIDEIYMGRLQLDDDVYCTMFNRKKVNEKYMHIFKDLYDIRYVVFLWKDFESYLNRLKKIGDDYLEYNKEDFEKVKGLYEEFAKTKYKDCSKIIYLDGSETFEQIHKMVVSE